MAQKSRRNRRRGPVRDNAAPPVTNDRYQKYLPGWMRDGAVLPKPQRPRRSRPPRPAGGYTPGKFAASDRSGL